MKHLGKLRKAVLAFGAAAGIAAVVTGDPAYSATAMSPTNLRSGPGTSWPVIGAIPAGADVNVINCAEGWRHSWCQVQYGTISGYVNAPALAISGADVVVAQVVTTDATNLRTSPSLFASVIEVILGGEEVDVIHCKSGIGQGWCHVTYDGKTGFVRGGLLTRQASVIPR